MGSGDGEGGGVGLATTGRRLIDFDRTKARATGKEAGRTMSSDDLKENPFRDEIFGALTSRGYVEGRRENYDFGHALDGARMTEFLEKTQPTELAKYRAA